GEQERRALVEDDQHGFEPAQDAVASPILCQLDRRSFQIAAIFFEFRLEAAEQGERVGRRSGKTGQDTVVVETTDLPGALLDDGLTERHLAVPAKNPPGGGPPR